MRVQAKGIILHCDAKSKPTEKGTFDYYLVHVVGMGIDETFFSMNEVKTSEKEVIFELEIKNGKVNFVGIK